VTPHNLRPYDSVLETIGWTPLIRLARIARGIRTPIYGKAEYANPGGSVKDRIGLAIIEGAERSGALKPGGVIVEGTSGNTGVGLAMAAAIKGYRCIFTMPDKMSQEKVRLLKAYGAEVMITPTAVPPDHPEHYVMKAKQIAHDTPGAILADQFYNQLNPEAHYATTGPEIWQQTDGKVTHLVAGAGTGGTVSGAGKFLKEQNPAVKVISGDPAGSLYAGYHRTHQLGHDGAPYKVEGIGGDKVPTTVWWDVIDEFRTVSDKDAMAITRRLAREEGILAGGSGGTSVHAMLETARRHGPGRTILTTIPDGGRGYLSKIFDDNWMLEHGFLERRGPVPRIEEVLAYKSASDGGLPDLVVCEAHEKIGAAIELMQRYGISQLPVVRHDPVESLADVIGSLNERGLLDRVFRHPDSLGEDVTQAMGPPLPAVDAHDSVDDVFADLSGGGAALVVVRSGVPLAVLTRSDLLEYLAHGRSEPA